MKKVIKSFSFILVTIVVILLSSSCGGAKKDSSINAEKNKKETSNRFEIFCLDKTHNTETILSGTDLKDFINTKEYENGKLVSDDNILYTFSDDLDSIPVSNLSNGSFQIVAFGNSYIISPFANTSNYEISCTMTVKGGTDTVLTTIRYTDKIIAGDILKDIFETNMLPNPFTSNNKSKFVLTIATAVAIAALVVSATKLVYNMTCRKQLDRDKYNCDHNTTNRCIEKSGMCHYKCIPCKN